MKIFSSKINLLIISAIIILCYTSNSFQNKFLKSHGHASNTNNNKVESFNYGLAKSFNKQDLFNGSFKSPTLIDKLPLNNRIETGGAEVIEEVKTQDVFYDGTTGFKSSVIKCNVYETQPQACVNNSNCGWCSTQNTCVNGLPTGPLNNECVGGSFIFSAPSENWNPVNFSEVQSITPVVSKEYNNGNMGVYFFDK